MSKTYFNTKKIYAIRKNYILQSFLHFDRFVYFLVNNVKVQTYKRVSKHFSNL